MTSLSPKAIKAMIDIEQGLRQAQDLVDNMRMVAWLVENKDDIIQAVKKAKTDVKSKPNEVVITIHQKDLYD